MPGFLTRVLAGSTLAATALSAALPTVELAERQSALWQPEVGSSFQIVITNIVSPSASLTPNVDIFDIDLFETDASTIQGNFYAVTSCSTPSLT